MKFGLPHLAVGLQHSIPQIGDNASDVWLGQGSWSNFGRVRVEEIKVRQDMEWAIHVSCSGIFTLQPGPSAYTDKQKQNYKIAFCAPSLPLEADSYRSEYIFLNRTPTTKRSTNPPTHTCTRMCTHMDTHKHTHQQFLLLTVLLKVEIIV